MQHHIMMFSRIPFDRVNWLNSSFLIGTSLVALFGVPAYFIHYGAAAMTWLQWVMLSFYLIATGMSITLGYHRLFSHLSFKAKWPVRLFTLIFGACAFENSAINWCSDHRRHHKFVDHDDDPYDITKGFFWAHMGWIMFKLNPEPPIDNVKDLEKDPLVRWQEKYYVWIALIAGLLLPSLLGFWHDGVRGALGGLLLAGVLRVVLVQHSTFFINSLCHTVGGQPYSSKCSARDSALMAIFTFGEGYHNYHHEFQHDFRNGVKSWQWDPTKWTILILSKLGLVSDLRRVPEVRILRAEMMQAQQHAMEKVGQLQAKSGAENLLASAQSLLERLNENISQLEEAIQNHLEVSKQSIAQWRNETRQYLEELKRIHLPAAQLA